MSCSTQLKWFVLLTFRTGQEKTPHIASIIHGQDTRLPQQVRDGREGASLSVFDNMHLGITKGKRWKASKCWKTFCNNYKSFCITDLLGQLSHRPCNGRTPTEKQSMDAVNITNKKEQLAERITCRSGTPGIAGKLPAWHGRITPGKRVANHTGKYVWLFKSEIRFLVLAVWIWP